MALIVDIILVIVLLCCVYVGWKNGFIKTLSGFFSYVLSFALANVFDVLDGKSNVSFFTKFLKIKCHSKRNSKKQF